MTRHHLHRWRTIRAYGIAVWEKQFGQSGGKVYIDGRIDKCTKCPKKRIVPFDKKYKTVEVES